MAAMRKPLQGVWNIIRFNWQLYALAVALLIVLYLGTHVIWEGMEEYFLPLSLLIFGPLIVSLLVSMYVYDLSGLYRLRWLDSLRLPDAGHIININAGFDETSTLLLGKFPTAQLTVLDFYDPVRHTEVSIRRARRAYPPYPGTRQVSTSQLPFPDQSADAVFVIFAAHEIRDEAEKRAFFAELRRVLRPTGQLVVTEHLRDFPNFLAYTIGFFHFYHRPGWLRVFADTHFKLNREIKVTPFVSTFILEHNGNPL